jgi:dTDP-L-rhamnose 4-epimerase
MSTSILITGGAGFIGSHLTRALLEAGHRVRVLDLLDPQVHPQSSLPAHFPDEAEFLHGDVLDRTLLERALGGVSVVYHLASLTSVTQSMYDLQHYIDVNVGGTAALLDVIVNRRLPVEQIVLSSSRAIYGEGAYFCHACARAVYPAPRPLAQLERGDWEMRCPQCGQAVQAIPTQEDKPPQPMSIYAQTKYFQEQLCTSVSAAYDLDMVILRYFNVYGPYQALSNPYTGIAPVFCTRILSDKPIALYEDGRPIRDFVHVRDVVRANMLALARPQRGCRRVNVGSGQPATIQMIAERISAHMGAEPRYTFTGQYRLGDIRSCYADLSHAQAALGYTPGVSLDEGIADLVDWVVAQTDVVDSYEEAIRHLAGKGLIQTYAQR